MKKSFMTHMLLTLVFVLIIVSTAHCSIDVPKNDDKRIAKDDDKHGLKPTQKQYYAEGEAKFKAGKFKEAIASYTKAIKLNQNYAEAYLNRGGVLFNKKNTQRA